MLYAPSENNLWLKQPRTKPERISDEEINDKYSRGEGRIVIETNREKLPNFVSALQKPNYMDLRPFYQRRPRWDRKRQSLLIESFIMNIPVPPVFFYEKEYNSYEVMDGQQRITALRDFYNDKFKLEGLSQWPEINGRTYHSLPDKLRAGLDRRSITSIVLLKESTADEEEALSLRETVFERLNTGGVALSRQEIRNALYQSKFNELILRLSQHPTFRAAWEIPYVDTNKIDDFKEEIENPMFKKMEDAELVLRFFALRHAEHYQRGMQGFLDMYMYKATYFGDKDISMLESLFERTIETAYKIYGSVLFRPYDPINNEWLPKPSKAFYDAVMVGLCDYHDNFDLIKSKKAGVYENTKKLFEKHEEGTFTGRGNTKNDVQTRINLFRDMLAEVISS